MTGPSRSARLLPLGCLAACLCLGAAARAADSDRVLPPTPQAWADLAKLPDWSGAWSPNETAQNIEVEKHPTPWNPKAVKRIEQQMALTEAGNPAGNGFTECLPEGMPTIMLIYHNSVEWLFTPGRVTMLGESDGNQMRRIHTDGRKHPTDPDLTFFGDTIGHWEGATLVMDTIGVMPEAPLAIEEAFAVPNGGDMHIVEHLHLVNADEMHDDLEITAPHLLTAPWKTTRITYRQRARKFEIPEGVCLRGKYTTDTDADGFPVLIPLPFEKGIALPPK